MVSAGCDLRTMLVGGAASISIARCYQAKVADAFKTVCKYDGWR